MEGGMTGVLTSIIQLLVGGLTEMAKGIGGGLTALVESIFVSSAGALTTFGSLVVIFAGISLAIGLSRWVVNFVTSLGSRNR